MVSLWIKCSFFVLFLFQLYTICGTERILRYEMHEFISISRCVFKLSYYLFSNVIKALNIEIVAQTGDFRGLLELYLLIAGSSETFPCNLMLTFTELCWVH